MRWLLKGQIVFGSSTEKRVMREADKIISLKEDMDALSWTRVLEIGKLLLDDIGEEERVDLARELMSIAQSNRSLYTRLGIEPVPVSRVMASGIEVMEGGLAEAALEAHDDVAEKQAVPAEEKPHADAPATEGGTFELGAIDLPVAVLQAKLDLAAQDEPDEEDFLEAAQAAAEGSGGTDEPAGSVLPAKASSESVPVTLEALLKAASKLEEAADDLVAVVDAAEVDTVAEDAASVGNAEPESGSEGGSDPLPVPESEPAPEPALSSEPASELAPESREEQPEADEQRAIKKRHRFARFRNLYESRDGGLCVFEDEHGHLVAVDASKLA